MIHLLAFLVTVAASWLVLRFGVMAIGAGAERILNPKPNKTKELEQWLKVYDETLWESFDEEEAALAADRAICPHKHKHQEYASDTGHPDHDYICCKDCGIVLEQDLRSHKQYANIPRGKSAGVTMSEHVGVMARPWQQLARASLYSNDIQPIGPPGYKWESEIMEEIARRYHLNELPSTPDPDLIETEELL